jgi:hypothetical protein
MLTPFLPLRLGEKEKLVVAVVVLVVYLLCM